MNPFDFITQTLRIAVPYLFAASGGLVAERAGIVSLTLEGFMLSGAFTATLGSYYSGSPVIGVLAGAAGGLMFGLLHGWICRLPRVNDVALGIALMLFGSGLAFFFGKAFIQPSAPQLPALALGNWSDLPQVRAALQVNMLFLVGAALASLRKYSID